MSVLPEIQERMHLLADELMQPNLFPMTNYQIGLELRQMAIEISRRPSVRRAPDTSRRMTPELRGRLRDYALANPDVTYQKIAEEFGVNAGRVSEAVAGKRR